MMRNGLLGCGVHGVHVCHVNNKPLLGFVSCVAVLRPCPTIIHRLQSHNLLEAPNGLVSEVSNHELTHLHSLILVVRPLIDLLAKFLIVR
jgi:hypothetical protein